MSDTKRMTPTGYAYVYPALLIRWFRWHIIIDRIQRAGLNLLVARDELDKSMLDAASSMEKLAQTFREFEAQERAIFDDLARRAVEEP